MNQELVAYIQEAKKKGLSLNDIRSALSGVGWDDTSIEEAIGFTLRGFKTSKKISLKFVFIGIIIALIVALFAWGVYLYLGSKSRLDEEVEQEYVYKDWETYKNEALGFAIKHPPSPTADELDAYIDELSAPIAILDESFYGTVMISVFGPSSEQTTNVGPALIAIEINEGALDTEVEEIISDMEESLDSNIPFEVKRNVAIGSHSGTALYREIDSSSEKYYVISRPDSNFVYTLMLLFDNVQFGKNKAEEIVEAMVLSLELIEMDVTQLEDQKKQEEDEQKQLLEPFERRHRDAIKTTGLSDVARALEAFYDDYGIYPTDDSPGVGCDGWSFTKDILEASGYAKEILEDATIKYESDEENYILSIRLEDINALVLENDIDKGIFNCDCSDPMLCRSAY